MIIMKHALLFINSAKKTGNNSIHFSMMPNLAKPAMSLCCLCKSMGC